MLDTPMEPPSRIYITKSALHIIEAEARHQSEGGQFKHETGGILIGRRLDHTHPGTLLIVAATRPGAGAVHRTSEFNPDVDYANRHLREYLAIYPQMDYIGIWHQHPPEFPMFSEGDVISAQAICVDEEYLAQEVINPIVWLHDHIFTIRYYYMNRAMAARKQPFAQIDSANIREIEDNHQLVQQEKVRPDAIPIRSERINNELRQLAAQGYAVELGSKDHFCYFRIQGRDRPDLCIYAVTSPNYPNDAPVLAVEQSDRKIDFDTAALTAATATNAAPYLTELARALATQIPLADKRPTDPLATIGDTNGATKQIGTKLVRNTSQRNRIPSWLISALLTLVILVVLSTAAFTIWSDDITSDPALPITLSAINSVKTSSIAPSIAATPVDIRWQQIETTSDIAKQITLLEALLADKISTNPRGIPTATYLFNARIQYIETLIGNKQYDQASNVAEDALRDAPAAQKQKAADKLAETYIANGDASLQRFDYVGADAFYQKAKAIAPPPSAELLTQIEQRLNETSTGKINSQVIRQAWQTYDSAAGLPKQIGALETIINITKGTTESAQYPVDLYDPRTLNVGDLLGNAYGAYGQSSLQQGLLDQASVVFTKMQKQVYLPPSFTQIASNRIALVNEVRLLWISVNNLLNPIEVRRGALTRLRGLIGGNAKNPNTGQTVASMLVELTIPTPTSTTTPSATEIPSAPPATEIPSTQPSASPVTEIPSPTQGISAPITLTAVSVQ